jgi:hypothetical protein
MEINMYHSPPKKVSEIDSFLNLGEVVFRISSITDAYKFIRSTTWNLNYKKLSKRDKGKVRSYLVLITGYSDIHMKRLIAKAIQGELYGPKSKKNETSFRRKYTNEDIALLAEFDSIANYPCGDSLRCSFKRMYDDYGDERFKRLSEISHGHVYNLRETNIYKNQTRHYSKTKPVQNRIGIREKPRPNGEPGYLRVDSVHGGDKDGVKGVYYVNFVDEVTQWQCVICVADLTWECLREKYEEILLTFPFDVKQFHSDNGSEFINKYVAKMLEKMHIRHTKSRPRKHNDNGLVESKNGWTIRKHFGYIFREKKWAESIDRYLCAYFNRYLNYHRPCAFPTKKQLANGKVVIKYKSEDYKTPYKKLKEIDSKRKYLSKGITYGNLDRIEQEYTDFEYLKMMKKSYHKLLDTMKSG